MILDVFLLPLCHCIHWKSLQPGLLATRWVGWKIRTGPLVVHLRKNGWAHLHSLRPALYPSRSQPPGDFQVKSKVLELQFSSQLIPLALHLGAKRNPALKASTAAEKVDVIHAGDCHKLS